MSRGRIEKALSGFYYVHTESEILRCRARGKFRRLGISPLVGDFAEVTDLGAGEGVVDEILPRKNAFARPAAANIDQLVIIASAAIPVTDPYLIDRISAIAALKGCKTLVVLNKCDLNPADALYAIYRDSAIPVLRVSAETGEGMEELTETMAKTLFPELRTVTLLIPYTRGNVVSYLMEASQVVSLSHKEEGTLLTVTLGPEDLARVKDYLTE